MRKLFLILMALVVCSWTAMAQTRTVKGIVVFASDGEPVTGATVFPIGGGNGIATDIDGRFTLSVPSSTKELQVSYVGMVTKRVKIDFTAPMRIELTSTASDLDELMVVAYGTAKKSAYTGSASVVKADAIENSLVSSATNALTGKVSGVQTLSSNGQPGVSPSIRIRGVGSINGSNAPLYVLDGVPYDGDIANINTMDIASMTVLKDAAAAALYGARGANGVILITTKRGQSGNAKVTVDVRWGANHRAIPKYDVIESTDTYMETLYKSLRNGYYYNQTYTAERAHDSANANIFKSLGYQCYTVPNGEGIIGLDGRINPNATLGYAEGDYYYTPDDWSKEQLRNGFRQEYNINVQGGNDRFNYYVSGSYLSDEGLIKNSHFRRLSTRTSIDYQIKSWLKIGTNIAYTYADSAYPGEQTSSNSSGNAFLMSDQIAPYYPMYVRNSDGTIRIDEKTGHKVYDYGDGQSTPYARNWMSISNPAGDLVYNTTDYLMDQLNGKWFATLTPVAGLSITGTAGYHLDNTRYHDIGNPFYGQSAQYFGTAYQNFQRTRAINLQALANYTRTFADKHDIDVLLGYESYDYNYEHLDGSGQNLYRPDSWAINNTIDNKNPYGSSDSYATRGIFGRLNYSFDSKYYFSFSVRRDASSRFAPDKRWGTFWSVSGAWDIAKENFLKNSAEWIDQLKIKASFGQQGNDNLGIGFYPWMDQYRVQGADGVWSDGTLYQKGNPDITWETSNNFNVGIDFSLKQGMLSGTIEYFNRQTSDMLYNKPVSPSNGYSSIPMNIGSMRNNGLEVELNYRPINTKDLTWNISANITAVTNKVLKLHPDLHGQLISGSRIYREGESMYQLYLVEYAGVDPATGLALYWDADPIEDAEGNIMKDERGTEIVGEPYLSTDWNHAYSHNRKSTGNLMPKAYGGFGTDVQFRGFDLSVSFAYQFGGKIWDYTYQDLMHNGSTDNVGKNWHNDIANAWTPENRYTNVPRLDSQDDYTNSSSTRWLTSSNYLSLQNITLGYTLPKGVVTKLGLESIRIYGAAENLFLLSARKGLDPRQGYVASEAATYKASRCISGGLRVEF